MRRGLSAAVGGGGALGLVVGGWSLAVMVIAVSALVLSVVCWVVGDAARSERLTAIIATARRSRPSIDEAARPSEPPPERSFRQA